MSAQRFIIHAGFHKTGTSSVQAMLRKNRRVLADEFRVFLRDDIRAICECARAYSVAADGAELALYRYEVAEFIGGLDRDDARPVVISAEDLCGHIPGRHGLENYDHAVILIDVLIDTAMEIAPQRFDFTVLLSTRTAEPWVKSCYAQHLRATRNCDDFATYCAAHLPQTDLGAWAQKIRVALTPVPVVIAPLEDSQNREFGPFAPLLELMQASDVVRVALMDVAPVNTALAPEILAQLRILNQSDLDSDALAEAKKSLIQGTTDAR